jgi:hypothetical protein
MAQQVNLIVDQGSHWSANVIAYTSNSTGTFTANLYQYANGAGQIRKSYSSANSTANIAVSIHPAGSSNNGTITLSMNNSVTGSIDGGRYLYDVEVVGGPAVTGFSSGSKKDEILRVCEGIITISPQVTKWDWN